MISASDIDMVTKDYNTTDLQKYHLFVLWIERYPSALWNDVTQALNKTGNHSMATRIEEKNNLSEKPYDFIQYD